MATAGTGTIPQMWGELFKIAAGVDLISVPYRGGSGPALTDLIGGQVDVTFDPIPGSIEFIKAGKLRALGVTSARRVEQLPEVPTIGQFVPGYDAIGWNGIGVPKNTPPEIAEHRRVGRRHALPASGRTAFFPSSTPGAFIAHQAPVPRARRLFPHSFKRYPRLHAGIELPSGFLHYLLHLP